jgi:class 3 adenylate cyclase
VEETLETAPAGNLELKGFARPISAYEVHGLGYAPPFAPSPSQDQ